MLTTTLAVGTLVLLYALLYVYRRRGDAYQDMVTGLPSRDFFDLYLQQCVARASRHPEYGFAVLLIELRGFDDTRRRLGRFGADEVLADFAERVILCIRPTDVIARLNEDNFAVLLDEVTRVTDATRVAVRVHESLTDAMTLAAQTAPVRLSVGVALSLPGVVKEAPAMLVEAESALERARSLE
ncbi:MAG: GGDEF domain-containing protein, partial [Gemmatimonadaceae bacterium]